MKKYKLPTAAYQEFSQQDYEEGLAYIRQHSLPIVLKADGLAAGKGVLICSTHEEALLGFEQMLLESKFGEAGRKVVIEAFLEGIEMSVFVLTDGKDYVLLPEAKDYKRIGEGDTGLNTGGMGAVSPVPFFDETLRTKVIERIVKPTISGIQQEQFTYVGFVFIGLMISNGDPYIIEYNCRMGDPETEVVIPRIQNDLAELLLAAATHDLSNVQIQVEPIIAVTTVAVSGGYPEAYTNGKRIEGLTLPPINNTQVFHAGTLRKEQDVLTNGGRVLAVTAFGPTVREAANTSRTALEQLHFEGMNYRRDIGYEF
jgi:phosphoribosylamine--glycine ligase